MQHDGTGGVGFRRILLVDDDSALTTILKPAIESQGYIVHVVVRGDAALETALVFKPDLVVLDVMMPNVDGWEVLGRLRDNPSTEHLPVIMLTAADTEAAKVKGLTLGADDYVTKPFSVQELRCRIAAVLRRSAVEPSDADEEAIPIVVGSSRVEFLHPRDIYYIEGIRNYSYVHSADSRFLSRLTLGVLESKKITGFMRVHRSYIVNLKHVRGCGWVDRSAYRLTLSDFADTEIPVSRALITQFQEQLGVRRAQSG